MQNYLSFDFTNGHICASLYISRSACFISDHSFKWITEFAFLFPYKDHDWGYNISTIFWHDSVSRKCDLRFFFFFCIPSLSGGFQSLSRFIATDPVIMSHFSKLPRKIRDKGEFRSKGKKRQKYTYKSLETQKWRISCVENRKGTYSEELRCYCDKSSIAYCSFLGFLLAVEE
jgi:hypothetical protein